MFRALLSCGRGRALKSPQSHNTFKPKFPINPMLRFLEKNRLIAFILFLLIAIEIFYISSLKFAPGKGGPGLISITYHFCVFFLFTTFLLSTIKGTKKIKATHLLLVWIVSFAYSFLDEFHQSFVPGRVAGVEDLIINGSGILFATIIYVFKEKSNSKSEQNLPSSAVKYENEHDQQPAPQRESYY